MNDTVSKLQKQLLLEKYKRQWKRGLISEDEYKVLVAKDTVLAETSDRSSRTDSVKIEFSRPAVAPASELSFGIGVLELTATPLIPTQKVVNNTFAEHVPVAYERAKAAEIAWELLPEDVRQKILLYENQLLAIDKEKAELSNTLGDYPPPANLSHITDVILKLREDWMRKKEDINVLRMGGAITAKKQVFDLDEYTDSLAGDRYKLKTDIDNMVANRAKKRKMALTAKGEAKKQYYSALEAELTVKIDAMRAKMGVLD